MLDAVIIAVVIVAWFALILWPFGFWFMLQFLIVGAFAIGAAALASVFIGTDNAKILLYVLIPIGFVVAWFVTKAISGARTEQSPGHRKEAPQKAVKDRGAPREP